MADEQAEPQLDAAQQAWVDQKEGRNYGGSADPEAIAAVVEEAKARGQAPASDFDDQLALDGVSRERTTVPTTLFERFVLPPFSVLDTRQGYWQDRRRAWLSLGIESEVGRGGGLVYDARLSDPTYMDQKKEAEAKVGRELTGPEFEADHYQAPSSFAAGTSVFDPLLCELAYRWFVPPGGRVLDPFAGGSVRGVVAGALGLTYGGIELRPEQVEANRAQADKLFGEGKPYAEQPKPRWMQGDAAEVSALVQQPVDFLFTCPPYADLEVYSDDPRDLSAMPPAQFDQMYADILGLALEKLRRDRFAAIVVAEIRGKAGTYRGFVPATIAAFEAAGASYYNEAIVVNSVGTGRLRARRQFEAGRKLVKVHQQMLVFVKGDPKAATEACGRLTEEDT